MLSQKLDNSPSLWLYRRYLNQREAVDLAELKGEVDHSNLKFSFHCYCESCLDDNDGQCPGHVIEDVRRETIYMCVMAAMRHRASLAGHDSHHFNSGRIWSYPRTSIAYMKASLDLSNFLKSFREAHGVSCKLSVRFRLRGVILILILFSHCNTSGIQCQHQRVHSCKSCGYVEIRV